ncbi:ABC transporter permease [Sulfobacillus harzensis]|uniref:ABC transporter permease n=1 Tax=Sulfobacillus harzensis TaxID=2729629 RepID=A0A7Y0Q465_9FIRM|nr:ABC transporter permease [Sulfobacillus harzensis]NMP22909.1 ABC transporter permease [Sulfobacillus harzensis]
MAAILENQAADLPASARSRSVRRFFRRPSNIIGLAIIVIIAICGLGAHWIAPYGANATNFSAALKPPSAHHLLGTDSLGRDVLSRIIYGTNSSILASLGAIAAALIGGTIIGLVAGYAKGTVIDEVLMRIIDAVLVLPPLVLAMALAFIFGQGLLNAIIAIAVVFSPQFARVVRSKVLTVRELTFVEAARAAGAGHGRILLRHIFPSVIQPALVLATLSIGNAVIVEASLAYLGLGLQPPNPSWGFMVSSEVNYLSQAPWLIFAPSLAIALSVFSVTVVGQGLQEL